MLLEPQCALLQVQEELCWCWGLHVLLSRLLAPRYWVWSLQELQASLSTRFWNFTISHWRLNALALRKLNIAWLAGAAGAWIPARNQPGPGEYSASALMSVWWISDISAKHFSFEKLSFQFSQKIPSSHIYECFVGMFRFVLVYNSN